MADRGAIGVCRSGHFTNSSSGSLMRVWAPATLYGNAVLKCYQYRSAKAVGERSRVLYYHKRVMPWMDFTVEGRPYIRLRSDAHIAGIVKESGVAVRRWVHLQHRKTGQLIDFYYSNADGSFIFYGLAIDELYYAVALDDLNASPQLNAVVFDILTPVLD